jgi:hypothetical protein
MRLVTTQSQSLVNKSQLHLQQVNTESTSSFTRDHQHHTQQPQLHSEQQDSSVVSLLCQQPARKASAGQEEDTTSSQPPAQASCIGAHWIRRASLRVSMIITAVNICDSYVGVSSIDIPQATLKGLGRVLAFVAFPDPSL